MFYTLCLVLFSLSGIAIFYRRHANAKKKWWMDTALSHHVLDKEECFMIITSGYECPTHGFHGASHIKECSSLPVKCRFVALETYQQAHYAIFACQKGAHIEVMNDNLEQGSYEMKFWRPCSNEMILLI